MWVIYLNNLAIARYSKYKEAQKQADLLEGRLMYSHWVVELKKER